MYVSPLLFIPLAVALNLKPLDKKSVSSAVLSGLLLFVKHPKLIIITSQ